MKAHAADPHVCPTCGDALTFKILDDERFLVAWSCINRDLVRATEPGSEPVANARVAS